MNILILNGSPRPKGSTRQMIDAFREGAVSAGHTVKIADVCKKKIGGCLACEYCYTKGKFDLVLEDILREFQGEEGKAAENPKWRELFDAICQDAIRIGMAEKWR